MATKTFEELKELAIQIRDEKTNKQNTANRVGTAMLEGINKLEQDYYNKTTIDEELKKRDDKLTELGVGKWIENTEAYIKEGIELLSDNVLENSILRYTGGIDSFDGIKVISASVKQGDSIYINITDKLSDIYGIFGIFIDEEIVRVQRGGDFYNSYGKILKIKSDCTIKYSIRDKEYEEGGGMFKITKTDIIDLLSERLGIINENIDNINKKILYKQLKNISATETDIQGIYNTDGNLIMSPVRYHSVFPVNPNKDYCITTNTGLANGTSNFWYSIAFLNNEKKVIGGITDKVCSTNFLNEYSITTPNDTAYLSISEETQDTNSEVCSIEYVNEEIAFKDNISKMDYGNKLFTSNNNPLENETNISHNTALRIKKGNTYKVKFAVKSYAVHTYFVARDINGNIINKYTLTGSTSIAVEHEVMLGNDVDTYSVMTISLEDSYLKKYVNLGSEVMYILDNLHVGTSKSVLWLGTSIPEGCPYPQNACANLGYKCFNKALGSSGIILNEGVLNNDRDGKDLSESAEEKKQRYQSHIGDGTSGTITQDRYDKMMNWGYDKRILPYINGDIAACDMIVFDHGYNDRTYDDFSNLIDSFDSLDLSIDKEPSDYDRTNFIGAFCFLINQIYKVNPNIKIVICSYLENKTGSSQFPNDEQGKKGYLICSLLEKIANHFNFPYLNMCDYNGFTVEFIPNTSNYITDYNLEHGTSYTLKNYTGKSNIGNNVTMFQYYCPDGTHPHTDTSKRAEYRLTESITKLLRDL